MEAQLVVAMLHIRLIAQRYSDGVDRGTSCAFSLQEFHL
jgi:hypothetical protein